MTWVRVLVSFLRDPVGFRRRERMARLAGWAFPTSLKVASHRLERR